MAVHPRSNGRAGAHENNRRVPPNQIVNPARHDELHWNDGRYKTYLLWYTIGDFENDLPLKMNIPKELDGKKVLRIRMTGPEQGASRVKLWVNGGGSSTYWAECDEGDGWVDVLSPSDNRGRTVHEDWIWWFAVSSIDGGYLDGDTPNPQVLCYMEVR